MYQYAPFRGEYGTKLHLLKRYRSSDDIFTFFFLLFWVYCMPQCIVLKLTFHFQFNKLTWSNINHDFNLSLFSFFFDIGRQLKELSIHFPNHLFYVGWQGAGAYPSF